MRRDGVVLAGGKAHPAAVESRQVTEALRKTLHALGLPDAEGGKVTVGHGRRPGPVGHLMAGRRKRAPGPDDLDPLYLRVSAKLLRVGVPHDGPEMTRRAAALGMSPEQHRDLALAVEAEGAGWRATSETTGASPAPPESNPQPNAQGPAVA